MTPLHGRILQFIRLAKDPPRLVDVARGVNTDPGQVRVAILSLEKRGFVVYDKVIALTATYDPLGADAAQAVFETMYPDCIGGSFNIGFRFGWEAAILQVRK